MLAPSKRPQIKKSSCSFNMEKLTINERWRLSGMLYAGMRINDIARWVNVHKNTVQRWRARNLAIGHLKDLPRSGRPRITGATQGASIFNRAENNRSFTGNLKAFYNHLYNSICLLFLQI